jgi:hypothetical protein
MGPITPLEGVWIDTRDRVYSLTDRIRSFYATRPPQKGMIAEAMTERIQAPVQPVDAVEPSSPVEHWLRETYTEYEVRQETNELIVRIIDAGSGEIVRVVPAEELAKELANQSQPMVQARRNVRA